MRAYLALLLIIACDLFCIAREGLIETFTRPRARNSIPNRRATGNATEVTSPSEIRFGKRGAQGSDA